MARAFPLPVPEFSLGGIMYPVDHNFDWSNDKDVLVDAVRQTHEAMRMHHLATITPDRDWLDCTCIDLSDHRDLLAAGHALLVATVLRLEPEAPVKRAQQLPVASLFLRAVQAVMLLVGTSALTELI